MLPHTPIVNPVYTPQQLNTGTKGLLTKVVCVRFQLLCPQVSSELLPSHVQGAYLRFPSATDLTTDYNGEYTCTVTSNRLPTRKLSAIFVVLEPGE